MNFKEWLELSETVYYDKFPGITKATQLLQLKKNNPQSFQLVQQKILQVLSRDWRGDPKSFVDGARHLLTNYSDQMQTMGDSGQEIGARAISVRYSRCQKYQFRIDFTEQTRNLVQALIDTTLDPNLKIQATKLNNDWFNRKMARYKDESASFNCNHHYPNAA
jgi:hypothetical protein